MTAIEKLAALEASAEGCRVTPTITFRVADDHGASRAMMDAMARHLGHPDGYHAGLADVAVPIVDVLTARGLYDALICLEWVGEDRILRLFAADCAERVVHLTGPDPRCVQAIRVARLYAYGLASTEELRDARAAARDTSWAAAGDAAWAAARAAAGAAAGVTSWAAAWATSWAATKAAAGGTAGAAAGVTSWAAAGAAARAAAGAAEQQWQGTRLRWYLNGRRYR